MNEVSIIINGRDMKSIVKRMVLYHLRKFINEFISLVLKIIK